MGTISLRLNERDDSLIRKYAELNGVDLSSFVREAVLEKIENEYDLTLFDQVWEEEKEGEKISHEKVRRELGMSTTRHLMPIGI